MSTKFGIMMQSGYSSAHAIRKIIEKLNFKYPRWQTADVLKKPILIRYHEFSIFKIAAVHYPGFFKLKFLAVMHFRDKLHHRTKFLVIVMPF